MRINIRKLIADLLITFTRDNKFIELLRVLTSQAVAAYNEFNTNVADWKYKAKANASVISLQHQIKRQLDVDVLITSLDGKPIDFLVSMNGFADEKKISQIIDLYGLSSRSYVFENGEPLYSSSFINYACEMDLIDNLISFNLPTADTDLLVKSTFPVNIDIKVNVKQTDQGVAIEFEFEIMKGETTSQQLQFWEQNQITSVTPSADTIYRYSFDNSILTNQLHG